MYGWVIGLSIEKSSDGSGVGLGDEKMVLSSWVKWTTDKFAEQSKVGFEDCECSIFL